MAVSKFHKQSTWLFTLYLAGMGLFLTGFGSHYWTNRDFTHHGLWRRCDRDPYTDVWSCYYMSLPDYPGWFKAVYSLMITAITFGSFAGLLYVFTPVAAAFQIVCAILTIISTAVYAVWQIDDGLIVMTDLGYSFWVICAGAGVLLVSGIVLAGLACTQSCHWYKILPSPEKGEDKIQEVIAT